MDSTNIASVVVAAIAAAAAFASQRAAANASMRNTSTNTRSDMELAAFERAKSYYTDTIDRQAIEILGLEADVTGLKNQVRDLRAELDTAKRTLRRAFPDAL